jgi:hypothetical protein
LGRKKLHTNRAHVSSACHDSLLLRALLFFVFGGAVLWGQEVEYRIGDDGRFIQFLSWKKQENVLYYEVEIEKPAGELWESALTTKTEALALEVSSLEVSLSAGSYRYRIRAYDLLGRPGQASDWVQFEILPAKQPELVRFSPHAFYLDEDVSLVIHLFGRNIAAGSEIFLQGVRGSRITPDTVTVEPSETEARLVFSFGQLEPGNYTIHVLNPGGLRAELETFRIAFGKPLDINISAGYKPLVSFYGYINELFDMAFFPFGAYGRLSVIPFKWRRGAMGFELEPSWNYFLIKQENYTVQAQMPGAAIYGIYQYGFSNQIMTLGFRIGGGIYSVLNYHFVFDKGATDPITILIPAAAAGVSFRMFVKKPFFVEAGLDFIHLFTVDNPSPGYLRPFVGAGWRF